MLAIFGVAGLDRPAFWLVAVLWEIAWLAGTAGRQAYRRRIDVNRRRELDLQREESRLNLYGRLTTAAKARHHAFLLSCSRRGIDPAAAGLLTGTHLRLLAAREGALRPQEDEGMPFLEAIALLEAADPELGNFVSNALAATARAASLEDPGKRSEILEPLLAGIELRSEASAPANPRKIPEPVTLYGENSSADAAATGSDA